MRELKFRVWDKVYKNFRPLASIWYSTGNENFGVTVEDDPRGHLNYDANLENSRFIVTQFIGLKDKNNQDIYEGDIVIDHSAYRFNGERLIWWAEYEDLEWSFWMKGNDPKYEDLQREINGKIWQEDEGITYFKTLEIIGNIYEQRKNTDEK